MTTTHSTTMVQQLAFQITTLIMIWNLASAQFQNNLAQPDCNSTCGYVDIPYPFGMNDPKCYADKWFEIECRNDVTPYLKSINLEVRNFSMSLSTISINNPIYRWNCKSKNAWRVVNLRGSPFVYSSKRNVFMAFGCNNTSSLRLNGSQVNRCVPICDDKEQVIDKIDLRRFDCLARPWMCCETRLPPFLSEYNATSVRNKNGSDQQCSYALIGTTNWYTYQGYEIQSLSDLKHMDYVPASIEWEIPHEMLNNNNSNFKLPQDASCYDTHIVAADGTGSGIRCSCYSDHYGNPYITGGCKAISDDSKRKHRAKWAIVGVSSSLGSIFLLLCLWRLYKVARKRIIKKRREKYFKQNGGLLLQQRLSSAEVNVEKGKLFSLEDLEKATDYFNMNRVLGKGGQGTVYKGMLVDGKIVAVKKFKVEGNVEEFINEFIVLSQINHRNVVQLLGCCLETEIPLLVYEFIPNGNLYEYLHDPNEDLPMTWDMRLRIASEIAGALFYLHSAASQPIYHRDIKTTNILLDEKYRAKVADFGTSRIISIDATHLTTVVQGTFGYLDPEYFHTSQFTEKSDVYSFGVVLVELLTGERPISRISSGDFRSLASYFVICMKENRLFDIIDKKITMEGKKEDIIVVSNIAFRCLELNGKKRPTMKEVTLELEGIKRLDRKCDAQQNHEEIELSRIEDHQPWTGYSKSDTMPIVSIGTISSDSEVMPIRMSNIW